MNANNVTAAKPKVGGAVYHAPIGSTLPTDATTALDAAFKSAGYISEDGLTNENALENEEVKAWGGDVVYNLQTGKTDHFTFSMLEAENPEVLKIVHTAANVSGALATGITIEANAKDHEPEAFVFEMVLRNNVLKRIVVPSATVIEVAEVQYVDNAVLQYNVTISATPDANGNTHYEYMITQ